MKKYMPRVIDEVLRTKLNRIGAVLVTGPKWCGKTTTASRVSKSVLNMQDVNNRENYMKLAASDPALLLEGETPRLIDEWQVAPNLWDAVRQTVDRRGKTGQFILTGSSVPPLKKWMHSGTGRIARVLMRPMSLFESGDSDGSVSLEKMFEIDGRRIFSDSGVSREKLSRCIVRGGWPMSIGMGERDGLDVARDYLDAIVNEDMNEIDGVLRNPVRVRKVIQSLARNTSTSATLKTICEDISGEEYRISRRTLTDYLGALERMYVIEDLEAWSPALRSKTAIRASPKRHFSDPSIACAALRASPEDLLHDAKTFGLLFESLCVRDLRVYADALEGDVFHYRDSSDLEVDAVIHLYDGRWAAIEVKVSPGEEDRAAENLLKLAKKVDSEKMNPPSFLMVLTAGELTYRREDGIYVVPLSCLGP